jgi:outer membrane receptor protein involved in Fe transport
LEFSELTAHEQSDQFEGAFIYQADSLNVLAGAAYADVDREDTTRISTAIPPLVPVPIVTVDEIEDLGSKDKRVYVYGNFELPNNVLLTLGGSYQEYDGKRFDLDEFNPKIGVVWSPTDSLRIRGAYFEVVKPVLSANRTLEPTQIAGFNQFFDDLNATRSERYGIGIDWQTTPELAIGAELTGRDLESPSTDTLGNPVFDDQDESTHRAYAYWTPSDRWAVSAEGVYDKFANSATGSLVIPDEVRTVSLPWKATYFHPQGLFASAGVTYVDQKVKRDPASTLPEGDDSFSIVDLALGYRLPQRRGVVSLTVHNLFDEGFKYQDNSYREFGDEPSVSPYTPERLFMGRLMLNF